jgi:dTDP-4-amino-4,6-dideoxygalactose transaminase
MINVTKTYLPSLEEYTYWLKKIWKKGWVTNNGECVIELEEKLKKYFGVKHLFFVSNGTMAIQLSIRALGITGEIITTPFSYVATTTSILWEHCTPVFADIDKKTWCINPSLIEPLITHKTQAILATHVYGIPCNIEAIMKIARRHKLRVIFDSAHAFGTIYNNRQLASYGNISTLSFHATKLFHTVEGGAVITEDDKIAQKISLYRSFGHVHDEYYSIGTNAKNSELHAAMGLCMFDKTPVLIKNTKENSNYYDKLLSGIKLIKPFLPAHTEYNYSYYPVLFENKKVMLKVKASLVKNDIVPRRYFYPSLNTLSYLKAEKCPVSEDFALRVLCLPLYSGLSRIDIKRICNIIIKSVSI